MQIYEIKFNFMNHSAAERIVQKNLYILRLHSLCAQSILLLLFAAATAHLYELHIHIIILYTHAYCGY